MQKHYSTRSRGHCCQLPRKTTALDESNFFIVYYIVTFYRLRLLIEISISDV